MSPANHWRVAHVSLTGPGHAQMNTPCQDYSCFLTMPRLSPDTIIAATADGLGSAENSAIGSRITAQAACAHASHELWKHRHQHTDPDTLETILNHAVLSARTSLQHYARRRQVPLPTLATTITLVIHTAQTLAAVQIGDGAAIVSTDASSYHTLLKPQRGEYANQTDAITNRRSLQNAQIAIAKPHYPLTSIALSTDGLLSVTMDAATHSPHTPFFRNMETWLRNHQGPRHPNTDLASILDQPSITQKTNDDISLILAVANQSP